MELCSLVKVTSSPLGGERIQCDDETEFHERKGLREFEPLRHCRRMHGIRSIAVDRMSSFGRFALRHYAWLIAAGMIVLTWSSCAVINDVTFLRRPCTDTFPPEPPNSDRTSISGKLELVGNFGGPVHAVAVRGDFAYVVQGTRLVTLDVSDPTDPQYLGRTEPLPGIVRDIDTDGSFVYLAVGKDGLWIVDVSIPASPRIVGSAGVYMEAMGVAVAGSHAYIADAWAAGLRIFDISDPANPQHTGCVWTAGGLRRMDLNRNLAYLTDESGSLIRVDVSNPSRPVRAGEFETLGGALDVSVSGSYAYVAEGKAGMEILRIGLFGLESVGSIDTPGYAAAISLVGSHAYLADGDSLRVVDVSDPANPRELSSYDFEHPYKYSSGTLAPEDLLVVGSHAYYAATGKGLRVIDVSDPSRLREVGAYHTLEDVRSVAVSAGHAYLADIDAGLKVVDISDPSRPQVIAAVETETWTRSVHLSGSYAYVLDGLDNQEGRIKILDISDPSAPMEVGSIEPVGSNFGIVQVSGSYAFLADESRGLRVLDVSDPSRPVEVEPHFFIGFVTDLHVAADTAYVIALPTIWDRELWVLDVSEPSRIRPLATYPLPSAFNDFEAFGPYLYGTLFREGLWVLDVSDPTSIVRVGGFSIAPNAGGLSISHPYAFVTSANGETTLHMLDISDPADPRQVEEYKLPGVPSHVFIALPYVYITTGPAGLTILRLVQD